MGVRTPIFHFSYEKKHKEREKEGAQQKMGVRTPIFHASYAERHKERESEGTHQKMETKISINMNQREKIKNLKAC